MYKGNAKGIEFKTLDRLVKYLNISLSNLIKYRKDYLELYIYNAKQMYDPDITKTIKQSKEIDDKTKEKYINLLKNGTYISLNMNSYNNFVINSSIKEKIASTKSCFYLLKFETVKLVIEEQPEPNKDIKRFYDKQKEDKEKSISAEEFSKMFSSMAMEKEIYIKSRIIQNSNLLDNISDNDTLMFNLEDKHNLITKTKKELLNDIKESFLIDLSIYDSKDKNYLYKIDDCSLNL